MFPFQGTCSASRVQLTEAARAAAVASGHHPSSTPLVFLPGHRRYPAEAKCADATADATADAASRSACRPPPAQRLQPALSVGGSTGADSAGGRSGPSASAGSAQACAPSGPPQASPRSPWVAGRAAVAAATGQNSHTGAPPPQRQAPLPSTGATGGLGQGALWSGGSGRGVLLSSEQQARIECNRSRALALMAHKGKRLPY
jgi:hypothetical protein